METDMVWVCVFLYLLFGVLTLCFAEKVMKHPVGTNDAVLTLILWPFLLMIYLVVLLCDLIERIKEE